MIVRDVTGYFLPRYPANIYPFLGQNVAKIIGNCEPGKRRSFGKELQFTSNSFLQPLQNVLSLHLAVFQYPTHPKPKRENDEN